MVEEKEERGFKVSDRRRFSESGEPRDEVPEGRQEAPSDAAFASNAASESFAAADLGGEALPEMSFSTFVISLSTQALILLGEGAHPDHPVQVDLAGAQQLIDIIAMLQAKTRGNLEPSEIGLLDNILYDLRMRYVQRARGK